MKTKLFIHDSEEICIADKLPPWTKVKISERNDIIFVDFNDRIYRKGFSQRLRSGMPISRDERSRKRLQGKFQARSTQEK